MSAQNPNPPSQAADKRLIIVHSGSRITHPVTGEVEEYNYEERGYMIPVRYSARTNTNPDANTPSGLSSSSFPASVATPPIQNTSVGAEEEQSLRQDDREAGTTTTPPQPSSSSGQGTAQTQAVPSRTQRRRYYRFAKEPNEEEDKPGSGHNEQRAKLRKRNNK